MGVSPDGMGEPETAPAPDGPQRPGYPPTAPATAVGRRGAATGQGIATRATAAIVTEMFTLPDVEYLDIAHDLSTTSSAGYRAGWASPKSCVNREYRQQFPRAAGSSRSGGWTVPRRWLTPPAHNQPKPAEPSSRLFGTERDDLLRQ